MNSTKRVGNGKRIYKQSRDGRGVLFPKIQDGKDNPIGNRGYQRYLSLHAKFALFIYSNICFPIWAGDEDTTIPASVRALILLGASPFPSVLFEMGTLNDSASMAHSSFSRSSYTCNESNDRFL